MRKYCIGAVLLDLNDPTKVIGRLREPLLTPEDDEREGYVPNVIYTCGALRHGGELILPYAISDKLTIIASIKLEELLGAIRGCTKAECGDRKCQANPNEAKARGTYRMGPVGSAVRHLAVFLVSRLFG